MARRTRARLGLLALAGVVLLVQGSTCRVQFDSENDDEEEGDDGARTETSFVALPAPLGRPGAWLVVPVARIRGRAAPAW